MPKVRFWTGDDVQDVLPRECHSFHCLTSPTTQLNRFVRDSLRPTCQPRVPLRVESCRRARSLVQGQRLADPASNEPYLEGHKCGECGSVFLGERQIKIYPSPFPLPRYSAARAVERVQLNLPLA